MVFFWVLLAIVTIMGVLFQVGSAFRSEKERQDLIFEEALFQKHLSLDNQNQVNEKKDEAIIVNDNIQEVPTTNSPDYILSLGQSQN